MIDRATYFKDVQAQKNREKDLEVVLKERLPGSDLATTLFEYLVVRRENLKEQVCKEPLDTSRGRVSELKDLIDLFK